MATTRKDVPAAHEEHGDFRSVFRRVPHLIVLIFLGIKRNRFLHEGNSIPFPRRVAMNRNRLGERFRFEEEFVVLRRGSRDPHRLAGANGHFPDLFSREVEDRDLDGSPSGIGDKDPVVGNGPLLDPAFAFRNQVHPFQLTCGLTPQLHNSQIGRVSIRNGQDSVRKEQRSEAVLCVLYEVFRSDSAFPRS